MKIPSAFRTFSLNTPISARFQFNFNYIFWSSPLGHHIHLSVFPAQTCFNRTANACFFSLGIACFCFHHFVLLHWFIFSAFEFNFLLAFLAIVLIRNVSLFLLRWSDFILSLLITIVNYWLHDSHQNQWEMLQLDATWYS